MSEQRHRADDDIEALTQGSYRTPNGETDLLDASSTSLNSTSSTSSNRSTTRSSSLDPEGTTSPKPPTKLDRQARLEARLAKRTSKVMNAYKSYLAQIEDPNADVPKMSKRSSTSSNGDNSANGERRSSYTTMEVQVGRPPFRDYEFKPYQDVEKNSRPFPPSATEYKDGLVQRSWTYRRENSDDEVEKQSTQQPEETFLDYDEIRNRFGIEAEEERRTPYKYPQLHSRRVKRGLVLMVLVAIVIGVSVSVVKQKKKAALPDWEAELEEVQKEEWEKHAAKQQEQDEQQVAVEESHEGQVMAKPPPSTNAEAIEPPQVQNSGEINIKDVTFDTTPHGYKEVVKKYNPISFDRSKGYDGQTYNEAVTFCSELENRTLCPYRAICPLGPASKPSGGYKTNGSWMAISDGGNEWVHLGSTDACTRYERTYGEGPEWGLVGKEESTRNIMCCVVSEDAPRASLIEDVVEEEDGEESVVEEESKVASGPGKESSTAKEESTSAETATVSKEEAATATEEDTSTNNSASASAIAPLTESEKQQIQLISSKLQPIYYNRSHGWKGQTYIAALEFCASQDSRVPCPYTAICPNGEGRPPLGGIKESRKGSFVPIIDTPNQWVQLSSRGVCQLHSDLYGSPPEWGLTGEGDEEMTRNIVCCREPEESLDDNNDNDGDAGATGGGEDGLWEEEDVSNAVRVESYETTDESESTEESSSGKSALTAAEQSVLDIMHPLWFGRKHGYQGTTYDDAVEFCKNVGGMSLCPLEAYCPNGPDVKDRPPLFIEMDAFEGEQWAPSSSHDNSWILVGTTDGDASSTCKTHEELHGNKQPSWGEDGTFTHLKENVMCCMNQSPVNTESTSDTASNVETPTNNSPTTVTATNNSLDMEQMMQTQLQPLWLGRKEGWQGGSHEDAMEFCKNFRGKQLCPYSAYCPHGAGQPVMGRHKRDFNAEGELYAPVFGRENHWVMIGQKGKNSATTCMSHNQLEGSNPDWGLTTDMPELKKYILCCTMNTGK